MCVGQWVRVKGGGGRGEGEGGGGGGRLLQGEGRKFKGENSKKGRLLETLLYSGGKEKVKTAAGVSVLGCLEGRHLT